MAVVERWVTPLADRVTQAAGGAARARVIVVLGAVLGLDAADQGTISATALDLQRAFHVGKAEIGLLLTVSELVGAAATLPFGILVDRVTRTRLLVTAIGLWSVAMIAGAASPSYLWLLVSRLALGAVTGVAAPAVASLIGDFFAPTERSRIYGMVLSGELIGTGLGIALAGASAAAFSWRAAFFVLAVPGVLAGWAVHRLPEPERGGASRLGTPVTPPTAEPPPTCDVPFRQAVRHVLSVRTNVVVIVSSALGYYFAAGMRAFGIEYASTQYHVGQGLASSLVFVIGLAAVAGVVVGGRVTDRLVDRGHITARITVPCVAFAATIVFAAPAIVIHISYVAMPLMMSGAFVVALANPGLDAARLDVMPPELWGRAEAIRSLARTVLTALAPLLFGVVADDVFGGGQHGLQWTFLVMLVPLLASGLILLAAVRAYPREVLEAQAPAVREECTYGMT